MHSSKYFFCITLLFLYSSILQAQNGCTDVQANNYNSSATVNNGSCTYNTTNASYTVLTPLSATVNETSGLIFWRSCFWTHNDSGGANAIYAIDSITGSILQTVTITNATNVDWEDIAQDDSYIYIGDFGNNVNGNRTNLRIYKIAKADINTNPTVSVTATIINYSYSDQTNFAATGSNNTDFDCEAFFVKDDSLYLFSKNWINFQTRLYRLPKTAGTYSAAYLQSFNVNGLITGADYIASCNRVVLVGYNRVVNGATFIWNLFDFSGANFFNGNKRRIETDVINTTGQVEGISFIDGNTAYVSRENNVTFGGAQQLMKLSVSSYCGVCSNLVLSASLFNLRGEHINGVNKIYFQSSVAIAKSYALQKMKDGVFNTIATSTASNSTTYMLQDMEAFANENKYRIKVYAINGTVEYSNVIKVSSTSIKNRLNARYMNGEIYLNAIPNAEKGFSVKISSMRGELLYTSNKLFSNSITVPTHNSTANSFKLVIVQYADGTSMNTKLYY
jgi:hypothetical protein